jgi:hypothetical protein
MTVLFIPNSAIECSLFHFVLTKATSSMEPLSFIASLFPSIRESCSIEKSIGRVGRRVWYASPLFFCAFEVLYSMDLNHNQFNQKHDR